MIDPWQRKPEYAYGGQWFDDLGALALAFGNSPALGIEIGRSGISRSQANDLASNLMKSGITPYDDTPGPIDLGA